MRSRIPGGKGSNHKTAAFFQTGLQPAADVFPGACGPVPDVQAFNMAAKRTPPTQTEKPADMISRHLGQRLKHLRSERGWSLETLAGSSGVSRSMLSQIEREQANPTLAVTLRIAQAFGMSLGELVEIPGASSSVSVIRSADRAYHYHSDGFCHIRTLSPLNLEKDVEFYEIRLKEGGALRSAPHFHGTREFLTVAQGTVRVESASDNEILNTGDSASYRADVAHAIVNTGEGEAVLFLVDIYK
jgi:transcriptional regulator with XRE-family HTH domain